ncbi:MAG: malonyl-CoA decarboxylase [Luminiphilus sp.]
MRSEVEHRSSDRQESSTGGLSGLLSSVISAGRDILARRRQNSLEAPSSDLLAKSKQLIHHRGEASGLALAYEVVADYQALDDANRLLFFEALADDFSADSDAVLAAADGYKRNPTEANLSALSRAAEAPRIKLFRRMNMAPDATPVLVKMRGAMIQALDDLPQLKAVETDLKHQFISWFNRGFLELRVIDWNTPASILERIIQYESVHAIEGWDDLRARLRGNRMCFAFFHPAMPDDPLVFVEVALTEGVPDAIGPLIDKSKESDVGNTPDTVVFYSISNCHPGLAGVSFGNFLIKQVVEEVGKRYSNMKRYVTLSPIPGFCRWLAAQELGIDLDEMRSMARTDTAKTVDARRNDLLAACAQYLLKERRNNLALDPVARFHLGNGASLHAIHWAADLSDKGLEQSAGLMVNYLYDLRSIEENHDSYFDQGEIARSRDVARLLN